MRTKRILIDIDHVLSDAAWRDHMLSDAQQDEWERYHTAASQDDPIAEMAELVFSLQLAGWEIVALTTRPEKWRILTNAWMLAHGINIDEILMRPDRDYRPTPELKVALAKARFPNLQRDVAFILDDREDVITAFKLEGIHALQVYVASGGGNSHEH